MKSNKLIKFLIPLVAVVVVFESIVLVNNLEKSTDLVQDVVVDDQMSMEKENPVMVFSFVMESTDSATMKVGENYKVDLVLTAKEAKAIDGMETYIDYDSDSLEINELVTDGDLAEPNISEVDSEMGIISDVFLIEDLSGLSLDVDEQLNVLSFEVTPLKEGDYTLKLNGGDSNIDHATLIVETGTAKSLSWTGGELDISVTK